MEKIEALKFLLDWVDNQTGNDYVPNSFKPNLSNKFILENNNPDEINSANGVMQLFGWQTTAGHKWAWCPETLADLMNKTGFETIEVGEGYFHNNKTRDFLIVGTK